MVETLRRVDRQAQCEEDYCTVTVGLSEKVWMDEDNDAYSNTLCPIHRAEEDLVSKCCSEEIVAGFCNGCGVRTA